MKEYIVTEHPDFPYEEPKPQELIRCRDCKWFGKSGCAILIVDESDMPKENDYCSWAERKED